MSTFVGFAAVLQRLVAMQWMKGKGGVLEKELRENSMV